MTVETSNKINSRVLSTYMFVFCANWAICFIMKGMECSDNAQQIMFAISFFFFMPGFFLILGITDGVLGIFCKKKCISCHKEAGVVIESACYGDNGLGQYDCPEWAWSKYQCGKCGTIWTETRDLEKDPLQYN